MPFIILCTLFSLLSTVAALPNFVCENPPTSSYFDYSAKQRSDQVPLCPIAPLTPRDSSSTIDDFSCSQSKPCSNGACCSKASGYCGYGPDSCGTSGTSPNDHCWSNCDAHAECGKFASTPGQTCPLNVCCSKFGFCGMTSDFCTINGAAGCQSNCNQPGSGVSGGNVQSRIIGYYESWASARSCSGMTFADIPVESLTHLNFAFGYISPSSFDIVPMESLDPALFSDLTALKSRNRNLKATISLGGWTFNDNGTSTQPVYGDMVSTPANRQKFISNLFIFLRKYAFDGVDFDWEYPGAVDRGGHDDDGVNYTQFLKELRAAIETQPTKYVVSFTAPTSYWYLRHFDIKNMMEYVDFANVMSYDLHGTWDSTDPIGSHVLAHTNLTEIKLALDLFWRNGVDPGKMNLGLGFYGRTFQLADPSCFQPGCLFKAGASPGTCTQNSGTLSYKEITQIIDQDNLTPYYDKENAVKYITWNEDQWASYDDQDTFQQKIKFANEIGLGGLLIWAIDLDTDDLKALRGVLHPKNLATFNREAETVSYWEDATLGDCRVTDCGGSCTPGEIKITTQPCGHAHGIGEHSSGKDSTLCCPLSAAPDPKNCRWEGTYPSCNGHCHPGQVALESNKWGDGKYCNDGLKFYCCDVPAEKNIDCSWKDKCSGDDVIMTFDGTFLETVDDILGTFGGLVGSALADVLNSFDRKLGHDFCCSPEEAKKWKNCEWHGQPGSCFDNHCETGHQVQLAESSYGECQSCAPRLERTRAFCCDPADEKSPFLPVPLEYLFPKPPDSATANTDFTLKVDPTWGTGSNKDQNEPNSASFGFVVLTSPEELQTTLDKRDGSHWELFDCVDDGNEDPQTIRMVCTDLSTSSNCDRIHAGHGVPGTILEMPDGCGPGRYAVAKQMLLSRNQSLPHHLQNQKRQSLEGVYDLTFDYDFARVPRDAGDTQMRIDFSNMEGYWDSVVDKAGETKRKRSLAEMSGNHRRWLEEEWRDDLHNGALSRAELHKRWFGSDVLEWLKNLVGVAGIDPKFSHSIDEKITLVIADEEINCPVGSATLQARLHAEAKAHIKADTSFGLTIITTMTFPPDLSNSYLYFKNKGEVSATFTLDAIASLSYSSGNRELFGLESFPGATFHVPGILTVGPNFRLLGSLEASVTLAGHLESQVNIASWSTQQTYPQQEPGFQPLDLEKPDRDGTQILGQPTFDYSVSASGEIATHLLPTITFGIDFEPRWKVDNCKVDLVADGGVRFHAIAEASSSSTNCPFSYGVDAGADLYAELTVPKLFGWGSGSRFDIGQVSPVQIVKGGSCPKSEKRSFDSVNVQLDANKLHSALYIGHIQANNTASLDKRDTVIGPLLTIPPIFFQCPNDSEDKSESCPLCAYPSSTTGSNKARRDDDDNCPFIAPPADAWCTDSGTAQRRDEPIEKRVVKAPKTWVFNGQMLDWAPYPQCTPEDQGGVTKWYTYPNDLTECSAKVSKVNKDLKANSVGGIPIKMNFATDHVFEVQFMSRFLNWLAGVKTTNPVPMRSGWTAASPAWVSNQLGITTNGAVILNEPPGIGGTGDFMTIMQDNYVGNTENPDPLAILLGDINSAKMQWMAGNTVAFEEERPKPTAKRIRASAAVFAYLNTATITDKLVDPSNSIENLFREFDQAYDWSQNLAGQPGRPNNVGGLRELWCYWIDRHFALIEAKIPTYLSEAKSYMGQGTWLTGSSNFAANYIAGEMTTGYATVDKMRFPRPNGAAPGNAKSLYGMWGDNNLGPC